MDSSSIKAQSDGTFSLELCGAFPPEWMGSVCASLSARRINVERGFAKQVQRGTWESMLVLRPLDRDIDMSRMNYQAMALAPKRPAVGARPNISSFKLDDKGDSLGVSIHAPDELGLLGRLLGSFSFLMLFVHEMHIQTVGLEAQDFFFLKGFAGAAPGMQKRAQLAASLEAMSVRARRA